MISHVAAFTTKEHLHWVTWQVCVHAKFVPLVRDVKSALRNWFMYYELSLASSNDFRSNYAFKSVLSNKTSNTIPLNFTQCSYASAKFAYRVRPPAHHDI
jgi:hypothetical protein